ncbi:MAG: hypothetical protein AAF769_04630 [Pseudomonadota bacterium]
MEALALLIGELIFVILVPFIALAIELFGAAISALVVALSGRKHEPGARAGIAKPVAVVLTGLSALVLVAVLAVNVFFFEQAVQFVFDRVEQRKGIATSCETIDGSLLTGRVQLGNCDIKRREHPVSTFDLQVAEINLNLRIASMFGTAQLDSARVSGLAGAVFTDRQAAADQPPRDRPRREFEIDELVVTDVRVAVTGINSSGDAFSLPIAVERLDSKPLRSKLLLFDVLFRANASGSLAGAPFELASSGTALDRRTEWRATQVPVASLADVVGGALGWFSAGFVNVYVEDDRKATDAASLDLDWQLEFSGLEVTPPPGTGRVARIASVPLTKLINGYDGSIPLEFGLVLDEDQFALRYSLTAAGVWLAIKDAVDGAWSRIGFDTSKIAEKTESMREGMRSVIDRVRGSGDEDDDNDDQP